jgi:hypothetical protein
MPVRIIPSHGPVRDKFEHERNVRRHEAWPKRRAAGTLTPGFMGMDKFMQHVEAVTAKNDLLARLALTETEAE